MRTTALFGAVLLSACSCAESHEFDVGMTDGGIMDSPPDQPDSLDQSLEPDGNNPTCRISADPNWTLAEPMPDRADSREVIGSLSHVSVVGSGGGGNLKLMNYDPVSEEWTEQELQRAGHSTATLLDSDELLLVGSMGRIARDVPHDGRSSDWARIFDPDTEELRRTADIHLSRGYHRAALLDDGQVLIAGGWHSVRVGIETRATAVRSTELFDPSTETWTEQGEMASARWAFSLTKLNDGRVLAVGGFDGSGSSATRQATAEIYNPATHSWRVAASLIEGRAWHEAQLLPSGCVLVVGGENQAGEVLASSELYDPATDTWSSGPNLPEGAEDMASLVLPSGRVLVAGGYGRSMATTMSSVDQVNLYDETANCWQALPPLNTARWHFGLARLPDGRIMAPGGWTDMGPTASVEITSLALD